MAAQLHFKYHIEEILDDQLIFFVLHTIQDKRSYLFYLECLVLTEAEESAVNWQ